MKDKNAPSHLCSLISPPHLVINLIYCNTLQHAIKCKAEGSSACPRWSGFCCFFYPHFSNQAVKFKIKRKLFLCIFSLRFHPSPRPLTLLPSFSITILILLSLLSSLLHAIACSIPFPSLPSLSVFSFQP